MDRQFLLDNTIFMAKTPAIIEILLSKKQFQKDVASFLPKEKQYKF